MSDTDNPQLDMSMEIARLEAELAAMRTVASKAMHNYETALMKLIKVEAELAKLQAAHEQCLIERNRLGVEAAGLRSIVERLKAENQWHPASEPPDHDRQIMIASAGGCHIWHGNRYNLIPSDLWREIPKPPREGGQ